MSDRTDMTDDIDTSLVPSPASGKGTGNGHGRLPSRPTPTTPTTPTTWVEPQRVPAAAVDGGGGEAADRGGNELRRLHQMMRGRYAVAFALSALGLAGGAYAGFRAGHQVYASVGQVRVMTFVPPVLYADRNNGQQPAYDSYVDAQVTLMKSLRVMKAATAEADWQAAGVAAPDPAVMSAEATVTREGEVVQVQIVDRTAAVAQMAVHTLIDAYQKQSDDDEAKSEAARLQKLRDRQAARGNDLKALQQRVDDIGHEYGRTDLKGEVEFEWGQVNDLTKEVNERAREHANSMRATDAAAAAAAAGRGGSPVFTPAEWARVDARVGELTADAAESRRQANALVRGGAGENNRQVVGLRQRATDDDGEVDSRIDTLKADAAAGRGPTPAAVAAKGDRPADPEALKAQIADLTQQRDAMRKAAVELGQKQMQIDDLQNQADVVKRDLDEVRTAIDHSNLEERVSGRIQLISDGSVPQGPFKDTRVTFAAAGGAGGALLGFALVLGLAATDRRVRSPDEATASVPARSILGLLPRLPDDLDDPERAAIASHCVHEVRTGLQLWARHGRHRVFAITSPSAGAGKTSLTLALGISYATAKLRTLVVDLDLIGHGLTTRVDQIVTRRLGRVLVVAGHLTAEELEAALERSRSSGKRLGDVLVESGQVTREAVDAAVADQGRRVGVVDVMHGTPLADCVAETGIPGLHVLGTGSATSRDVPLLSPATVQHLVNLVGDAYDVVLIDTGPILGSLEAQLVSAVADGVVLTVSKGASRPLVARAVEQLSAVGGRFAGIVFNRASNGDLIVYSGSTSQARSNSVPATSRSAAPTVPMEPGRAALYGPLAVAVAQSAPDTGPRPESAE